MNKKVAELHLHLDTQFPCTHLIFHSYHFDLAKEHWNSYSKIPWLVQVSSAPDLHNAGTQVHSMEESQIARQ